MAEPKKTTGATSNRNSGGSKTQQKPTEGGTGDFVSIHSMRPNGHRRAGMRLTREPQILDASLLDEDQKQALTSDPFIKIGPTDTPKAASEE